jgi:hypothetical protein
MDDKGAFVGGSINVEEVVVILKEVKRLGGGVAWIERREGNQVEGMRHKAIKNLGSCAYSTCLQPYCKDSQ